MPRPPSPSDKGNNIGFWDWIEDSVGGDFRPKIFISISKEAYKEVLQELFFPLICA
jgi:hypothetical protein